MGLYNDDEISVQDANPVELYLFTYENFHYTYTSSLYTINQTINGESYAFVPEYIKRSDSLKLGDSSGTIETCTITVLRTNNVALLFQGPPPENDSVKVEIWRQHGESVSNVNIVRILRGTVSQVRFHNSDAELTITIEHVLTREIPRGKLSYYCQNMIYDSKCNLDYNAYKMACTVYITTDSLDDLKLQSIDLRNRPSGYFTDEIERDNYTRAISSQFNIDLTLNK
mgnify:CR=1 FL=1